MDQDFCFLMHAADAGVRLKVSRRAVVRFYSVWNSPGEFVPVTNVYSRMKQFSGPRCQAFKFRDPAYPASSCKCNLTVAFGVGDGSEIEIIVKCNRDVPSARGVRSRP